MTKKKVKKVKKKLMDAQTWTIIAIIVALGVLAWLIFDQTMLFLGLLLGYLIGQKY